MTEQEARRTSCRSDRSNGPSFGCSIVQPADPLRRQSHLNSTSSPSRAEGERGQRERQAAEAQRGQRHDRAHDDRDADADRRRRQDHGRS